MNYYLVTHCGNTLIPKSNNSVDPRTFWGKTLTTYDHFFLRAVHNNFLPRQSLQTVLLYLSTGTGTESKRNVVTSCDEYPKQQRYRLLYIIYSAGLCVCISNYDEPLGTVNRRGRDGWLAGTSSRILGRNGTVLGLDATTDARRPSPTKLLLRLTKTLGPSSAFISSD